MTAPRIHAAWLLRLRAQANLRALPRYACGLALLGSASTTRAQELAGTYNPSAQRIEVQVVTWGEDCGTRPQSQTLQPQGQVTIKTEGAHLALRFSDRTLKTNGCWSPNPAVRLVSATSANGRFRAECKTAPGDAKRENGRYTATAANGIIELLEESDYDWQLKSSHCVAKLRMTQTLTSTRLPAPTPTPAATPATPAPACVPGPATRLRLRPADARLAPGERLCFSARATDAAGCAVELAQDAVSYALQRPAGVEGALNGSCFKAAANAALAEGQFKLVASSGSLRAEASINVSAPDLSDITARRGPNSGGPLGGHGSGPETALESGIRAVASGSHGTLWLGVSIAGLAALLSLVAIAALRMARRQLSDPPPAPPAASARPSRAEPSALAPVAPQLAAPAVPTGPQRICPRCRRGYPPGTERCSSDGEPLLDYDVFAKRAAESASTRHCPECGDLLASDAQFCGRCGTKVGT
ncbi:MAG TPA: zinc ribbon domain-containing protein [Polyangiales bacterium]